MGGESVKVIGRHRKSHRFICLTMAAKHLANWRAELVYSPYVWRSRFESSASLPGFPPILRKRIFALKKSPRWATSRCGKVPADQRGTGH